MTETLLFLNVTLVLYLFCFVLIPFLFCSYVVCLLLHCFVKWGRHISSAGVLKL